MRPHLKLLACLLITMVLALVVVRDAAPRKAKHVQPATDSEVSGPNNWQAELARRGQAELTKTKQDRLPSLVSLFGPHESMPHIMREHISHNLGGIRTLHLQFAHAQHVRSRLGVSFWIVDGKGVTCLFRDGLPATACRTSTSARREGIWLGTYATSRQEAGQPVAYLALGVSPKQVNTVVVRSGSVRRSIKLLSHTWAARSRKPIHFVRSE